MGEGVSCVHVGRKGSRKLRCANLYKKKERLALFTIPGYGWLDLFFVGFALC